MREDRQGIERPRRATARAVRAWPLWLLLCAMRGASAQLALPGLQLPGTPDVSQILPAVGEPLPGVDAALQHRIDVRVQTGRLLMRRHPDLLELDPHGELIRRAEVLAISPSAAAEQAALALGFTIARRDRLPELGIELMVWRCPDRMSTRRALAQLRLLDPAGTYDYNHVFQPGGSTAMTATAGAARENAAMTAQATRDVTIGMIDGGVDPTHPDLAPLPVNVGGCNGHPVPSAHGTAIASLLALAAGAGGGGNATPSAIQAIDVYCGRADGGSIDALGQAFAALVLARVRVVNISLVGPRNLPLEVLVRAVQQRGVLIVAATGNDGPAAAPLYPAASPGVIAVTAVDANRRVLPEAGRGEHVMFAAPGADFLAADAQHGYQPVRGTSFAAPLVAGLLARRLAPPGRALEDAVTELQSSAIDLGRPGRDPVYGFGLVGADLPLKPARAR